MTVRDQDGILWIPRKNPKLEAELDSEHERIGTQLKWKRKEKKEEKKSSKKTIVNESPIDDGHASATS